jgi:hypothetical protein
VPCLKKRFVRSCNICSLNSSLLMLRVRFLHMVGILKPTHESFLDVFSMLYMMSLSCHVDVIKIFLRFKMSVSE